LPALLEVPAEREEDEVAKKWPLFGVPTPPCLRHR
jgi:hypothetical protein